MTTTRFQLNSSGDYANKINTGEWHNVCSSSEYLAWLAEGNTPEPAPAPPAPVELTAEEKLAASGLTLDDLAHLTETIQKRADKSRTRGK